MVFDRQGEEGGKPQVLPQDPVRGPSYVVVGSEWNW
jgi:hypothetical protein